MHLKFLAALLALAAGALPGLVSAQEYPPLIKDLPPGYDLNGGLVLDMLGIQLGQPRTEARAAIDAALPGMQVVEIEGTTTIRDQRGNSFVMKLYSGEEVSAFADGVSTYVRTYYTSAASGERVSEIDRMVSWEPEQETDATGFIAALREKYGEPSLVSQNDIGSATLDYVWYDGALVTISPEQARSERLGQQPSPARCLNLGLQGGYSFVPTRQDQFPGCTAILKVDITYGARTDLMKQLDIHLLDYRRVFDDGLVTDAYLVESLTGTTAAKPAAAAPAL